MSHVNQGLDPMRERQVPTTIVDAPAGNNSAVSWAAIFAGAAGAAALSLLLMILGTGLGFSAVSPWSMEGISATTFGVAAIVWLSFTQLAASGMGGYLAGRLRTKWTDLHTDEVYFRDTAHGFLTWAVASLLTAVIMTSVVSAVGSGVRVSAEVIGGAAGAAAGTAAGSAATMAANENSSGDNKDVLGYFVDSLFRTDARSSTEGTTPRANQPSPDVLAGRVTSPANEMTPEAQVQGATPRANEPAAAMRTQGAVSRTTGSAQDLRDIPAAEVTRIVARALYAGELPEEDQSYIAQLIAQQTGLSQQDAEQRVSEGFNKVQSMLENAETTAREAADEARKASAYAALWMAVALLFGAFVASLMAVYGGRQRDA